MPLIKSFQGIYRYKDEECVQEVIKYPFKEENGYINDFSNDDYRNLHFTSADDEEFDNALNGVVEQFRAVQNMNTRAKIKMNHFVVSYGDVKYISDEELTMIKNIILNYIARKWQCQVFCVDQWSVDNPHIHFVMNHINMFGRAFLARYDCFWDLISYLKEATNLNWEYTPSSESDYC